MRDEGDVTLVDYSYARCDRFVYVRLSDTWGVVKARVRWRVGASHVNLHGTHGCHMAHNGVSKVFFFGPPQYKAR